LVSKRKMILTVQAILTVLMIVDFFVTNPSLNELARQLTNTAIVLGGFTLSLGAAALARFHINHITKRTAKEWYYSIWTLVCVVLTFSLGLASTTPFGKPGYDFLTQTLLAPFSAAIYAIAGFCMFSLMFRSFVGRSVEVVIFLISAFLLLMKNAPIAEVIWSGLPIMGDWVNNVPSMAGLRGITIGAGVGLVASVVRGILGLERGGLGRE